MSAATGTTYANARLQDVIAGTTGWKTKIRRVLAFAVKAFVGAWFCQGMFGAFGPLNILGSVVVVGWTYRLMQRQALKTWWKNSQPWNEGVRFQSFLAHENAFREHLYWPNFFLRQNFLQHLKSLEFEKKNLRKKVAFILRSLFASLGRNFRIGLQGILTTWVVTGIPVILLQVAWHQGWDNSFNKGYEQAAIGPVTFFSGVFLFVVTMFYVPLAQARQAVSGEWRSFFHYKTIRQVLRRRWFACFLLAGLYALVCIPIFFSKSAIYGIGNQERIATMTPVQQLETLNGYLFQTSLFILLPAFALVRVVAAGIYASAVREAAKAGDIALMRLSPFESEALRALEIGERPPTERSLPTRFILWTGSLTGRVATGLAGAFLWLAVVFQPAVQQFFVYQSGLKGYLNHPLIQLPWFHYVPEALRKAALEQKRLSAVAPTSDRST